MSEIDKRIEDIWRRVTNTTPGRWYSINVPNLDGSPHYFIKVEDDIPTVGVINGPALVRTIHLVEADAEFIANAKSDILFLLEKLEEKR